MSASLTFVSVNIERSKHLDLVLPFLAKRNAEVVCIQELMERDIPLFEKILGMKSTFAPMTQHPAEGAPGIMGIGIFSLLPMRRMSAIYYVGNANDIPDHEVKNEYNRQSVNHAVLMCELEKEAELCTIATTHFTWTPNGDATDDGQRRDVSKLLEVLGHTKEFVLSGDFNAKRGGEIFTQIAEKYKDAIPREYTSSIDGNIHRSGALPYMVDGLFTTAAYAASNVELVSGVSDHCAIVATITKAA